MNGTSHIPSLEAARPGLKIIAEVGDRTHSGEIEAANFPLDRIGRTAGMASEFASRCSDSAAERFPSTCPTPSRFAANCSSATFWSTIVPKPECACHRIFTIKDEELETAIAAVDEILKERSVKQDNQDASTRVRATLRTGMPAEFCPRVTSLLTPIVRSPNFSIKMTQ